jgi:hypothetical protein
MMTRLLPALVSLTVCAACADEPKRPPLREYNSVSPQQPMGRNDALPQPVRDALTADAMKRSGLSADKLAIVSAEKTTWNDGALGCPQPGQMYTQAIVPGYRVWVRAGERMLIYHTSESGELVLCPTGAVRQLKPNQPVAE